MDRTALRQILARRAQVSLKWQEPPPAQKSRGAGFGIMLPELDKHPGRWAILREYPMSKGAGPTASRLRMRYPGYEFVSRTNGGSGSVLYGRKLK